MADDLEPIIFRQPKHPSFRLSIDRERENI
jgi:hypothetical protein